jgi:dihydroorotase
LPSELGNDKALLLRSARLIDPTLGFDNTGDVLIRNGQIVAVGVNLAESDAEIFEARGLVVCPGLADLHVHFRTPGGEAKEDIISGSAAAAAGGFTDVVCEPNTRPPLDSGVLVAQVLTRAERESSVHLHQKGCLTLGGLGEALVDIGEMKASGAIALSSDGEPIENVTLMREALIQCRKFGLLPMLHDEAGGRTPLSGNSHEREPALVSRDIEIAAETHAPVHFSHVSMHETVEAIRQAKRDGLAITAEVTPQHLALYVEEAPVDDANFKVNPPLRSARDREAMRQALATGIIDCVATDHAPHTPAEKAAGYTAAPFGMIGLETALGVVLTTMYHSRLMNLAQVINVMSTRPRQILGLPEVRLAEGYPANLTIFDPDGEWVVDLTQFRSKARNCPFAGQILHGRAVAAIVKGKRVT